MDSTPSTSPKLCGRKELIVKIGRFVDIVDEISIGLAGFALIFVVLGVTANVFMRYVFTLPIKGVFEVSSLLMPVIIFMSLAEAQRHRSHIRISLILRRLAPRTQLILEIIAFVLGFTLLFTLGWQGLKVTIYALDIDQCLYGITPVSLWPFRLGIVVGSWLFCVELIRDIVNNIVQLRG